LPVAAVGVTAFLVYLSTLAPGLVAETDAPAFQLAGPVLGVPHNPGYPVYVLIGHALSYLPIGSPAYRMNLLSAICGGLAVAVLYLLMRRLGARPFVAAAITLAAGFGRIFWSSAVVAEVYTLEAALVAGMVLGLLVWHDTKSAVPFYASIACLALSLAHHTTDVLLVPAMGLYVLASDPRWALKPRRVVAAAAIVALGLLPYGLILVRTWQHAPMLESHAATLGELLDVVTARQFTDRVFAFSAHQVILERIPLILRFLVGELTPVGTVAAIGGGLMLVWRRSPAAWLILLGPIGFLGFAANYRVIDPQVFLVPVFVLGWAAAAVGFEGFLRLLEPRAMIAGRLLAAGIVVLPVAQIGLNFHVADHHRTTSAIRYFGALFDYLPDRSVVLREDFLVDRMVSYELLAEHAAHGRDVQGPFSASVPTVEGLAADGWEIFAFSSTSRHLRQLGFPFAPVVVPGPHWSTYLDDLPSGSIVAIASPSRMSREIETNGSRGLAAIGGIEPLVGRRLALAAIGVRGNGGSPARALDSFQAEAVVGRSHEIGGTGVRAPATITARSGQETATILADGREIVRTDAGLAIAVWDSSGGFRQAVVADERAGFRVPIINDGRFWPGLQLFRLDGPRECKAIRGRVWTDVASLAASGSMTVSAPGGVGVRLFAGGSAPLDLRRTMSGLTGAMDVRRAESPGTPGGEDGMPVLPPDTRRFVVRGTLTAPGPADTTVTTTVTFDGVPAVAFARVDTEGTGAAAVTACATRYDGFVRPLDHRTLTIGMANTEQALLLGRGWGSPEANAWAPPFRRTVGSEAQLLVPLDGEKIERIRVAARGRPPSGTGEATISLTLNGLTLPTHPLGTGWESHEWTVPPGVLTPGVNVVSVQTACAPSFPGREACRLEVGSVSLIVSRHGSRGDSPPSATGSH